LFPAAPPTVAALGNWLLTFTAPVTLTFAPQGVVLTTALLQGYYPTNAAGQRMLFWNNQAPYFTGLWDRLHKKFFSGVGIASSLIHLHNPPCGTVSAMVTGCLSSTGDTTVNLPDLEFGLAAGATYPDPQPQSVSSVVDLSADELVEALMFRFTTYAPTIAPQVTGSRFNFKPPTSSAGEQILQSFTTRTFSPESTFSKALADRESKFDPVLRDVGGVQVTSTEESRGCWVRALLKDAARTTFAALRFATPGAAGLVCNFFLAGSGPLCAVGVDKVVRSIESFAGIEADQHEPTPKKEVSKLVKVLNSELLMPGTAAKYGLSAPTQSKKKRNKSRNRNRSQSRGRSQQRVTLPSRSPSRRRGSKSPARGKSPARSGSRSKSPGRRPRSALKRY